MPQPANSFVQHGRYGRNFADRKLRGLAKLSSETRPDHGLGRSTTVLRAPLLRVQNRANDATNLAVAKLAVSAPSCDHVKRSGDV